MARIFISHSSVDKAFVKRLAEDLRHNGARVWLDEWELRVGDDLELQIEQGIATHDYFLMVISRSSVASRWVERELAWALEREAADQGNHVLPIRVDDAPLPDSIAERKWADFADDYDTGLHALLQVLRFASVKDLFGLPGRRIIAARRGVPTTQGTRHRIGVFAMGGGPGCMFGIIEAMGDPKLEGDLTGAIGSAFETVLRNQLEGGTGITPADVTNYMHLAFEVARLFKLERKLPIAHSLGVRMSLALQIRDRVFVATVGQTSAVIQTRMPEDESKIMRFQSENAYSIPLIDLAGVAMAAPIGFIGKDQLTKLEVRDFPFTCPDDRIALLSFDVTRDGFTDLAHAVVGSDGPDDVARLLAESREPEIEDTLCALLVPDPQRTEIWSPGGGP